jgi:anti-sigma factor RsiW
MNAHEYYKERLPLLAVGQLSAEESSKLQKHLEGCPSCRAEFDFWILLSDEFTASNAAVFAPADIPERALVQIRKDASPGFRANFLRTYNLMHAQAYLVKR